VLVCSGNAGIPSILSIDACIHDGLLALTNIRNKLSTEYLYYAFIRLKPELMRLTTNGGIWSNLTTDIMKSVPVPIPPDKYVTELLETLKTATHSVKLAEEHLNISKKTYGKLLNHLLGSSKAE